MIKLGVCTGLENAQKCAEIGFDYIELSMSAVAALPQEAFELMRQRAAHVTLPVYAMNGMLPGEYHLCGDDLDMTALNAYLARAFGRAKDLGVQAVVFGSGAARRYPESMEYAVAMDRLVAFLRLAGPLAESNGLTIAVEPLREMECNIINSVMEARQLAKMANLPSVGVLADLYHMAQGREGFMGMRLGPLVHCHIAECQRRAYPKAGDGSQAMYDGFFEALRHVGYDGGVSIEGSAQNFEQDARQAFALLDGLRKQA